jgi:hypothetical protein
MRGFKPVGEKNTTRYKKVVKRKKKENKTEIVSYRIPAADQHSRLPLEPCQILPKNKETIM